MTFLGSGSSPAFLARSLSAAAKVDMGEGGGEGPSTPGAGPPGEGEDGADGALRAERSEIKGMKGSIPNSYEWGG